jgi:hypothetical protein
MRGEFQRERHPSATERQNACQLFVGKGEEEDETLELSSMTYPPAGRDIAMSDALFTPSGCLVGERDTIRHYVL